MLKKRKCPVCGISFIPKNKNNFFHNRKCFKKDYYRRKEKLIKIKNFPVYICPNCGQRIKLDFDPAKKKNKWLEYRCPRCHTLKTKVCEGDVSVG